MDITWHGHSCFRLRGREVAIVTDPYDRSAGYPSLRLTADVVTGKLDVCEAAARLPDEVPPETIEDDADLGEETEGVGEEATV